MDILFFVAVVVAVDVNAVVDVIVVSLFVFYLILTRILYIVRSLFTAKVPTF